MRTDGRRTGRGPAGSFATVLLAAFLLAALAPVRAVAQVRVGAETEVRSIAFRGVESLSEQELRDLLHTRSRGAAFGLRVALGRLPLIGDPARHVFHPRVLQEDVVRLRRRYRSAGFLEVRVAYEVGQVGDQDLLDIVFVVEEGPPQMVVDAAVTAMDSVSRVQVPPDLERSWTKVESRIDGLEGRRLDERTARREFQHLQSWWWDNGYHRARSMGFIERDSLHSEGRLRFLVDPGPRRRFGPVTVTGNSSISDRVVLRELSFKPGDVYSAKAVRGGRSDLQQLQIVRTSRLEALPPVAAADGDSVVPVLVTVTEAKPRLVSGQLGYVTDAGLSAEARWTHRNFTGDARVFTVSGLAQSGLLAATENPDIKYRGTVTLQQPYLLHRRLSGAVSPFVEYREDMQDRSLQVGSNFTLIYRRSRTLTGSLDYQISRRNIYEYRLGELASGGVDLLSYLTYLAEGKADSLGTGLTTSLITASATAGTLDDPANPRLGVLVRPTLQVTAPTGASSANYWLADFTAYGFAPLAERVVLAGRFTGGRLFPFGKSLPQEGASSTPAFLRLRDASFTAGGGADVRGWGRQMLGPKFPDVRFAVDGDTASVYSDGYVAIGGHARTSFTVELRLPMPGLGRNFGSRLFLDGGHVWTSDERFDSGSSRFDQERWFYATGAGLDLLTPVGSISLSLGYKLNPSLLDLVDSDDLLHALLDGEPADGLPQHNSRRWQLHLTIGASY